MRTRNRSAAAPARGLALLSAASLLLVSVAAPAFAEPLDTVEDAEEPIEFAELEATLGSEAEGEPVPDDEPVSEGRTEQGEEELDEGEPAIAQATSQTALERSLTYSGQGSDSVYECAVEQEGYLHWILTPGGPYTLSDGTLSVGGNDYSGAFRSDTGEHGAMHFDTTYYEGAEDGTLAASVSFTYTPRAAGGPPEPNFQLTISSGCYPDELDEEITITLVKEWFDGDRELITEPLDLEWQIELYTSEEVNGEVVDTVEATLSPSEGSTQVELEAGTRYGVRESVNADGWVVADCDEMNPETPYDEHGLRTTEQPGPDEDITHLVCNQEILDPDTITVTLKKAWFGTDGEQIEGPDTGWEIQLTDDDVTVATLPGDGAYTWTEDQFLDDDNIVYSVYEDSADGWEAVNCEDVNTDGLNFGNYNTGPMHAELTEGMGAWNTSVDQTHLVCNQEIDDDNGPPPPEDDPLSLVLVKDWAVTDEDDLWSLAEAAYTLTIDGVAYTAPVEVEEGDELLLAEQDVTVSDGCTFDGSTGTGTYVVDADDAVDGVITRTITNEVSCEAEVDVLPIVVDDPEEEPEPEIEPEPVVEPEPEPEVLPTVLERALPRTGAAIGVLSLLGAVMLLLGGTAVRWSLRRGQP